MSFFTDFKMHREFISSFETQLNMHLHAHTVKICVMQFMILYALHCVIRKLRSLQIVLILITFLIGIDITIPNLVNKAINESSMGFIVIHVFLSPC